MTIEQATLTLAGLMLAGVAYAKYYLDAKLDPIAKQVDLLVHYMIGHEGKIAKLEERTK